MTAKTMHTPEELDRFTLRHDLKAMFPSNGVGRSVGAKVLAAFEAVASADEYDFETDMRAAATYVGHQFRANAYTRAGDMAAWFEIPSLPLAELVRRGKALRAAWDAQQAGLSDEDLDRIEREDLAREAEEERIQRIEDENGYGRTVRHTPEFEDYLYVRFGRMPRDGLSRFGLAGEDTEDGPDEWRLETGGKTHELGVCVFRAYRHPDVPGAYVVLQPHFDMALYGVPDFSAYMCSVIPEFEPDEEPTVLRIDGSLVTRKAHDRTLRVELGSDGEYMIDTGKPHTIERLTLDQVWVTEAQSAAEFLAERRPRRDALGL